MSKEKKVKLLIEVDEDLYNKCLEIKDFTIVKAAIAIGNGIPITDDCISREWVIHNVLSLIDPETRFYVKQLIDSVPSVTERLQGECCGSCYLCDVGDCGEDMKDGAENG